MQKLVVLVFIFSSFTLSAQRFLPVIDVNEDVNALIHGPNDDCHDLTVYEDKLVVVGRFPGYYEVESEHILSWDGDSYSPFEQPLELSTASQWPLDVVDTPFGLVVSGKMADYNNVVVFSDGEWQELAEGLNNKVFDIEMFEGVLFACGEFTFSAGTATPHVAQWDGENWTSAGSGMNANVADLVTYNNELYAVGEFTEAGNQEANYISKWNGLDWEPLEYGFNAAAYSLAVIDDILLIGGSFTGSDDESIDLPFLAQYDGNWISPLVEENTLSNIHSISSANGSIHLASKSSLNSLNYGNGVSIRPDLTVVHHPFELTLGPIAEYQGEHYAINYSGPQEAERDTEFYMNNGLLRLEHSTELTDTLIQDGFGALVLPSATLFSSPSLEGAGLQTNLDLGLGTFYAASPWVGNLFPDSTYRFSGHRYHGDHEDIPFFQFGPVTDSFDIEFIERYMRVWRVTQDQIELHQTSFNDEQYTMPEAISSWPGNGRPEHGESTHIAPFEDVDQNGWYNPNQGDYPLINGDKAVYYIINDQRNTEASLGVEIGVMLYMHEEEDVLENTIFATYFITNKSNQDFDHFKFAFWADFEIGNGWDDYIGSEPSLDLFYSYNGDPFDESSSFSVGYGDSIPAQGITFLSNQLNHFTYFNSSPGPNDFPHNASDCWNYMNSRWTNGQPILYGGDGYSQLLGADPDNPTNYVFPTCPSITEGDSIWNEYSVGFPPGDRRGAGTTFPFGISAGETACVDVAFITAFPSSFGLDPSAAVLNLKEKTQAIKDFYAQQVPFCESVQFPLNVKNENRDSQFALYPNPVQSSFYISTSFSGKLDIQLIDLNGRLIFSTTSKSQSEIDISSIEAGVYIVKIQDEFFRTQVTRIIKD